MRIVKNMSTIEFLSITISIIALVASLISLWSTTLSPARFDIVNDPPTFTLYKITPNISGNTEGATWWIPSFDLGISIHNLGARAGKVYDLRITASSSDSRNEFLIHFHPVYIVNYSEFKQVHTDRFKWTSTAVIREWYPILLNGKSSQDLHVLFEDMRWDTQWIGDLELKLEVAYTTSKWVSLKTYSIGIHERMYECPSAHTVYNEELKDLRLSRKSPLTN